MMEQQSLADKLLQHTVNPTHAGTVADYAPDEIRLACQDLISRGHDSLAIAVGEAAYALHPMSQDILSITALMAVSNQDWGLAIERMSELVALQGVHAQEFTYIMLARAQRCDLDPAGAIKTVVAGLQVHPTSEALQQELAELREYQDAHTVTLKDGEPQIN
jgi:hypothetical protein